MPPDLADSIILLRQQAEYLEKEADWWADRVRTDEALRTSPFIKVPLEVLDDRFQRHAHYLLTLAEKYHAQADALLQEDED